MPKCGLRAPAVYEDLEAQIIIHHPITDLPLPEGFPQDQFHHFPPPVNLQNQPEDDFVDGVDNIFPGLNKGGDDAEIPNQVQVVPPLVQFMQVLNNEIIGDPTPNFVVMFQILRHLISGQPVENILLDLHQVDIDTESPDILVPNQGVPSYCCYPPIRRRRGRPVRAVRLVGEDDALGRWTMVSRTKRTHQLPDEIGGPGYEVDFKWEWSGNQIQAAGEWRMTQWHFDMLPQQNDLYYSLALMKMVRTG